MSVNASPQTTSIGLVGDIDDFSLIEDCKDVFGITFEADDLLEVMTVGDFYDVIIESIGADGPTACCYTQKGFYSLRRRLHALGVKRKIMPQTSMFDILDDLQMSYEEFRSAIDADLEFHNPQPQLRPDIERVMGPVAILAFLGFFGFSGLSFLITARFIGDSDLKVAILATIVIITGTLVAMGFSAFLTRFDTELPLYCATVGGFSRVYGAVCFDDDTDAVKEASARDIWDRFTVCLRSENGYGGPIDRQTTIFGNQENYPAIRSV